MGVIVLLGGIVLVILLWLVFGWFGVDVLGLVWLEFVWVCFFGFFLRWLFDICDMMLLDEYLRGM